MSTPTELEVTKLRAKSAEAGWGAACADIEQLRRQNENLQTQYDAAYGIIRGLETKLAAAEAALKPYMNDENVPLRQFAAKILEAINAARADVKATCTHEMCRGAKECVLGPPLGHAARGKV